MQTRLMEQICRGSLGHELVNKGFTLYELDDHSVCLEYDSKHQWFFSIHAPITRIRETAVKHLIEVGKL